MVDEALAVQIQELTKSYTLGKVVTPVLKGITFSIRRGDFIALIGPSGSGKSTLLNLIGGLDRPTSGRLTVFGQGVGSLKDRQLAHYRQREVGMIFQSFNLLPNISAEQNVLLPALLAGDDMKAATRRANELMERVGLSAVRHHRPAELSGGEQQRVAVVRALLNRPKLLLAAEPTGNLDSASGKEVIQAITNLARDAGSTLLVVTHDDRVAAAATHTIHLLDGKVETGGRP